MMAHSGNQLLSRIRGGATQPDAVGPTADAPTAKPFSDAEYLPSMENSRVLEETLSRVGIETETARIGTRIRCDNSAQEPLRPRNFASVDYLGLSFDKGAFGFGEVLGRPGDAAGE